MGRPTQYLLLFRLCLERHGHTGRRGHPPVASVTAPPAVALAPPLADASISAMAPNRPYRGSRWVRHPGPMEPRSTTATGEGPEPEPRDRPIPHGRVAKTVTRRATPRDARNQRQHVDFRSATSCGQPPLQLRSSALASRDRPCEKGWSTDRVHSSPAGSTQHGAR